MNNDSFSNMGGSDDSSQFVLSFELLTLLQWLLDHDADKLKKIITKALASGLKEEIQRSDYTNNTQISEEARYSVVEFLGLLEGLLHNALQEQAVKSASEKNLMPAIEHIDSTVCDNTTLRFGIEKATSKLQKNPQANPQQLLFEEILRLWKPHKKETVN